ncbi:hypothetical protein N7532_008980 [Penicillium argentinense]|uniref:protein S-acyltransferase n=1 Tax=Penicillium argentinense TaxID=1131581 RepID=A0A9W9EYN3_9EURO|nr:uncharacterized protein N7532_008980 [Penicillium argentinense]KAJ5090296.1 hypothetical protein N7532_008980 [Penicillium argentinense]
MPIKQVRPSPLLDLPIEILLMIADILDTRDVGSFLRTARRYASILDSHLYQRARSHICADENSVLEWAAKRNQAPVIRKLLRKTRDAPIPLEAKSKALCLAAEAGMHCIIELLVDAGADLSSAIDMGRSSTCSALQLAAGNGHETAAHILLGMGADIAATNSIQETALHYAARGGHESVTRLLLERGADVAALTIERETALHYAVPSRNEAVVKLLLEKGVDLEATSSTGHTALFSVFDVESSCSESILDLLLAKGANVAVSEPSRHLTPLHFAAQDGNERAVRSLLANGADVMDRDYLGHTALHIAAESGNEAVVRMLLEKGADVSAVAVEEDDTPRNFAKSNGHEAIARLLEEAATLRLKNLA